jgi:hypothetical protein
MKRVIISLLVSSILVSPAFSQMSLQDQINAVDNVHQQNKSREQAAIEAAIEQQRQAQAAKERLAREQQNIAKQKQEIREREVKELQAKREKLEREQQAKIEAQRLAKEQELLKDKQRDQAFEDDLRKIAIEEKRLELEMRRAKVKRSDEYIDHELRANAANTDVVQSGADAVRNLSEGEKALLEREGESRVHKAGGGKWWNW